MNVDEAISAIAAAPGTSGIFTDFDGTLSAIVDRPELAQPVDGAVDALAALAGRFAVVSVVSGRSLADLRERLPGAEESGVLLAGSYGRERSDRPPLPDEDWEAVATSAAAAIDGLAGVVLERKGAGVALHYRAAPEHGEEVDRRATDLARTFGLDVLRGRLVAELARPGPGKGDAIAEMASHYDVTALLVAGDDVADVEAFEWARNAKARSVLVAVISEEAPAQLEAMADLVLRDPVELVDLLRRLG